MFDIRGYRHMKKSEQEITFYDGYIEDEFVRITVHVTDHLTGNHSLIIQPEECQGVVPMTVQKVN